MSGSRPTTVLYRGPLERSRLGFLLQATKRAYGEVQLVWLVPPQLSLATADRHPGFQEFLAREGVEAVALLDGRMIHAVTTIRAARRVVARSAPLVCVGFSALPYGRALSAG